MEERKLDPCQNCGAEAVMVSDGAQAWVECSNSDHANPDCCGMKTPPFLASLEYGAKDRAAAIWNRGTNKKPGARENPLPAPQAAYDQCLYYLEESGKLYLCFKPYKGPRLPSELVDHNFALVAEG